MSKAIGTWQLTSLAHILTPISRPITVEPLQTYPLLGMHWYAEGLYIKECKQGAQIQADLLYQVKEGDFVYNRLFAWKGSFGIAGPDVADCYVSNEFPCFRVDESRAFPAFLLKYFSQSRIWQEVQESSNGTTPTSRLRLKEVQLLAMEIPLPPLDEQRCIVVRIDALVARIEEARGLRREAAEEAERLWLASAGEILSNISETSTLKGSATIICGQHLTPDEQAEAGIPYITGPADFTERVAIPSRYALLAKATSLPDDVLLTVKGAGVGKVNLAPAFETVIGRQLFAVRPYPGKLSTLFLFFVLQFRLSSLRNAITATTVPGIGRDDVESLEIPLPSLDEQRCIVAYLDELIAKADALKQLQTETAAELEALLPAVLDQAFRGGL